MDRVKEVCPWSSGIGYDCEKEAGHAGNHAALDLDGVGKVGWSSDHQSAYRRNLTPKKLSVLASLLALSAALDEAGVPRDRYHPFDVSGEAYMAICRELGKADLELMKGIEAEVRGTAWMTVGDLILRQIKDSR